MGVWRSRQIFSNPGRAGHRATASSNLASFVSSILLRRSSRHAGRQTSSRRNVSRHRSRAPSPYDFEPRHPRLSCERPHSRRQLSGGFEGQRRATPGESRRRCRTQIPDFRPDRSACTQTLPEYSTSAGYGSPTDRGRSRVERGTVEEERESSRARSSQFRFLVEVPVVWDRRLHRIDRGIEIVRHRRFDNRERHLRQAVHAPER